MDTPEQPRDVYRSSGKVDWLRFLPGLVVTAGTAVVMAGCLFGARQLELPLIPFATPVFAALPVAGVWHLVLTRARCRNRAVAIWASALLALLLYLGNYYIGMLQAFGAAEALRVDRFPGYLRLRMETDYSHNAREVVAVPDRERIPLAPNASQQALNWLAFGGELLAVIGVLVVTGAVSSSPTFCESCGKWMKSEKLALRAGVGKPLWNSLQQGDFAALEFMGLTRAAPQDTPGCRLIIDYCPDCPTGHRSPAVYLTVKDCPVWGKSLAPGAAPKVIGGPRTLLHRVALRPGEVGALAVAFPGLRTSIEAQPLLFAEAHSTAREIQRRRGPVLTEWTGRAAVIEAVEPGYARRVLTRENLAIQAFLFFGPGFAALPLAMAPVGIFVALHPKLPDWLTGVLGVTAVIWMLGLPALSLIQLLCFPRYLPSRFLLWQTRRAFARRPGPAVDLRDPDLVFVTVVPRTNWGREMVQNASDIGFLHLDRERRLLIFEGDCERYRIPVESILQVGHESWSDPAVAAFQYEPPRHDVIVVRVTTAEGPREVWFYRPQDKLQRHSAERNFGEAMLLQRKILQLMTWSR
jgi:hypothetical protein